MATDQIHVFERAGLGLAPFRLAGVEDTGAGLSPDGLRNLGTDSAGIRWETTPGGTCQYCGHAIIVLCWVESSDGKRFHVGSDCIEKVGGAGMVADVRRIKQERQKERERGAIERLRAMVAAGGESVAALESAEIRDRTGSGWFEGSAADRIRSLLRWGGHSGRMRAVRIARKVLGKDSGI